MHVEWKKRLQRQEREIESLRLQIGTVCRAAPRPHPVHGRPNFIHLHNLQQAGNERRASLGSRRSLLVRSQALHTAAQGEGSPMPIALLLEAKDKINAIAEEPASSSSSEESKADLGLKKKSSSKESGSGSPQVVVSPNTVSHSAEVEKLFENVKGPTGMLRETCVELELYRSLSNAFKEELMKRREQVDLLDSQVRAASRLSEDSLRENERHWNALAETLKASTGDSELLAATARSAIEGWRKRFGAGRQDGEAVRELISAYWTGRCNDVNRANKIWSAANKG